MTVHQYIRWLYYYYISDDLLWEHLGRCFRDAQVGSATCQRGTQLISLYLKADFHSRNICLALITCLALNCILWGELFKKIFFLWWELLQLSNIQCNIVNSSHHPVSIFKLVCPMVQSQLTLSSYFNKHCLFSPFPPPKRSIPDRSDSLTDFSNSAVVYWPLM